MLLLLLIATIAPVALVLGSALPSPSPTFRQTGIPTLASIDDKRLYSYFCLSQEQRLCIGLSTDDAAPVYDPNKLYELQVKRRDLNEAKGTDAYKMRWAVDRVNGIIQLSNFTQYCAAKEVDDAGIPGKVVMRPCGESGRLELFDLSSFLTNVNEEGRIARRDDPTQCLSMMLCTRMSLDYCNPGVRNMFTGATINIERQRGAYVRYMPCVDPSHPGYKSQMWRQTIDCAPGCSPFMMIGGGANTCDQECNNAQCNFDNWACTTSAPTPPTPRPSRVPSSTPTTSRPSKVPSRAPTTSRPSRSPSTSRPSRNPTTSPTTTKPSYAPSRSPTTSPTTSVPSLAPSRAPSTSKPSKSPTTSPTTSRPSTTPSRAPTRSPISATPTETPSHSPSVTPSKAPSTSPSVAPSFSPSVTPTRSPTVNVTELQALVPMASPFPWWIFIVIALAALLLCCCCVGFCVAGRRRRRRKEEEEERRRREKERDLEQGEVSPAAKSFKAAEVSPIPLVVPREVSTERPRTESDHLVKVEVESGSRKRKPSFEELESRGAVGLLWGGNEDSIQEMTPERVDLKRRSEKLTRERLKDLLSQRSFSMPLEEVHEGAGEGDQVSDGDYDDNDDAGEVKVEVARPPSRNASTTQTNNRSGVLADSAMDFYAEPSAVQHINVEGMSIKELKSFIVENGGELEGCQEKDQLVARAKTFA